MIAAGSNEVRKVFVGDGQVHGEITYEYLIEPEVNRQLENVAIPYKNNPAYVDRITVTRRTIQNGSIIAIDYKDVNTFSDTDETYAVWLASDQIDDIDNNYNTKIGILNKIGYKNFVDVEVNIPFDNPFDDDAIPTVYAKIKQLSERGFWIVNDGIVYPHPNKQTEYTHVVCSHKISGSFIEQPIDAYICGRDGFVVTCIKYNQADLDGNFTTKLGIHRIRLDKDNAEHVGFWICDNVANNDYNSEYNNHIVYDPFHDDVYVNYWHTHQIWKCTVSNNSSHKAIPLISDGYSMSYLTAYSHVGVLRPYDDNTSYLWFHRNGNAFNAAFDVGTNTDKGYRSVTNLIRLKNPTIINYKDKSDRVTDIVNSNNSNKYFVRQDLFFNIERPGSSEEESYDDTNRPYFVGNSSGSWCRFGKYKPGGSPSYYSGAHIYWRSTGYNGTTNYLVQGGSEDGKFYYRTYGGDTVVTTADYFKRQMNIDYLYLSFNG